MAPAKKPLRLTDPLDVLVLPDAKNPPPAPEEMEPVKLALKGTIRPVHEMDPDTFKVAKFAVMFKLLRLPCGAPPEGLVGVVAPSKV